MRNKKHQGGSSWKLFASIAVLVAAVSFCTPYPERFVRMMIGREKPLIRPAIAGGKGEDKTSKKKPIKKPVAEQKEKEKEEKNDPKSQKKEIPPPDWNAWSPEASFAMPIIQMPAFPPALPERVEPGQYEHINQMAPGISIASNVIFDVGSTASQDRMKDEAYQIKVQLNLALPQAGDGEDLRRINPKLPKVLPQFDDLMAAATISPWFHSMMLHKQNRIRKNAATLSRTLDRHNFYDTETILEIEAPETKRKIIWLQADMDVVSDGSDGDRLPEMPKEICESSYYQPTTSYRWEKLGKSPNPLLPYWEQRLAKLKKEKGSASSIDFAQRTIFDLKRYSFLLADYDPFIVLPLTLREGKSPFEASAGDYVVVIVGNKAYPAIVGDYGPYFKSGEASLRLCREINPRANTYSRPISDLSVSYLIFPQTKEEKNGPIDYEQLYQRCNELLNEIGGLGAGVELEHMHDKLPPLNAEKAP